MAKHKKKQKTEPKRKVILYFEQLDQKFGKQKNLIPYFILIYLFFFSVLGLIWMIPFPQFDFLVRMEMHTFFNWASILIAIMIYSYLKLAPTLSYAVLISIWVMSYFIVQLEYREAAGGMAVWMFCFILFVISSLGLLLMAKQERKKINLNEGLLLVSIGPIWVWSKLYDRFKWKY